MNPLPPFSPSSTYIDNSSKYEHNAPKKETSDHHPAIAEQYPKPLRSGLRDLSRTSISQVILNNLIKADIARKLTDNGLGSKLRVAVVNLESHHGGLRDSIHELSERIACRTKLSTTGYQSAMARINNASSSDDKRKMTLARAKEYIDTAKKIFPEATLKSLAELQKNVIYKTFDGKLLAGIEMSEEELTYCLKRCREHEFANCDIQALETGLHLQHKLKIKNFTIFSNRKMSHNYVVLDKSSEFPKGAIIDPWTGRFLNEMDSKQKFIFSHWESNLKINKNMHSWIDRYGKDYILD